MSSGILIWTKEQKLEYTLEQCEAAKKNFEIEEAELSLKGEFKHLQPVESWSTLTSLLRIVAPKVHKKRLEWLLEKNDESIG